MGDDAFRGCTSLDDVYYTSDIASWLIISFGDLSASPLYNRANLYLNGKLATDIVIPDGVTSIGDYSFEGCTSLISVTIGNSVASIGKRAFSHCTSLTTVNITDNVTSIGFQAFSSCSSLKALSIGDGVTSIGEGAFYSCDSLISVSLPDSVEIIGESAFSYSDSLTTVTIGSGIKSIGRFAFSNKSLKVINFRGTKEQWLAVEKEIAAISKLAPFNGVVCTNGKLDLY